MTKFTQLESLNKLTPEQMTSVKGGITYNTDGTLTLSATTTEATSDDKRRERPSGGISTH